MQTIDTVPEVRNTRRIAYWGWYNYMSSALYEKKQRSKL